jgi:hypothetical protein
MVLSGKIDLQGAVGISTLAEIPTGFFAGFVGIGKEILEYLKGTYQKIG